MKSTNGMIRVSLEEDDTLRSIREELEKSGTTLEDALREAIAELKKSHESKRKKISPRVGV